MRESSKVLAVCITLIATHSASYAGDLSILGKVVDVEGKPAVDVDVVDCWRANGTGRKPDGTPFNLQEPDQLAEFWGHLGEMQPFMRNGVSCTTAGDGTFSTTVGERTRALFSIDSSRQLGAITEIRQHNRSQAIEIQLRPLITIRGRMRSTVGTQQLDWSHVYVELPFNLEVPLASCRLISCGSFDGRFEFRLPPGNYRLNAYGISEKASDNVDLHVTPAPEFTVDGSMNELDLGVLSLTVWEKTDRDKLEKAARAEGRWSDYTKHFGELAPNWHATDARGISKDMTIADFRGKWLLIDFWGPSCAPCMANGIPKLMDFYAQHAAVRDRFEIVGICIDFSGDINNLTELDTEIAPVVKSVWRGRKIPFPVVLDCTFTTWERYGIPGLGTVVLIDREGKLVEGDETTLDRILRSDAE